MTMQCEAMVTCIYYVAMRIQKTGSVSVFTKQQDNSDKPRPHDNELSIKMALCKNSMFSDLTCLYLFNKTTSQQLICFSRHSQQQLSVDTLKM